MSHVLLLCNRRCDKVAGCWYTGRYGESHCAMIVKRSVKMSTPIATSSAPETSSILW